MKKLVSSGVALACALLATVAAEGGPSAPVLVGADPVAWRTEGDALRAVRDGVAFPEAPYGRKVRVSADITVERTDDASWATAGVAVYGDERTFWHVAFVQIPKEHGGGHAFELAEMFNGEWPVQNSLKQLACKSSGGWEFGKAYSLELSLGGGRVDGVVREKATGRELFRAAYDLKSGPSADWGRPALRTTGRQTSVIRNLAHSVGDVVPGPEPSAAAVVPYASESYLPGVTSKATGFFRVELRDGRWDVIDPLGRGFVPMGVDHVSYYGHFCEKLGYAPYNRHNLTNYASKAEWETETLGRLKAWGFTMLGAGDNRSLAHRGLVHTVFLSIGDRLCSGDPEWYICENLHAPGTAFPNVFHPDFAKACAWTAEKRCAPHRNDPWLFGYFLDNEFAWWGRRGGKLDSGLFDTVNDLPDAHSAKRALVRFVGGRKVTPAIKLAFLELCAERYFAIASAAVRKADPNHMVLGCRFAGTGGAHPAVWRIAGKHSDIVTFNCYPWADLDRNAVFDRRGGERIADHFQRFYDVVRKPFIITEWSFPALDTGRPCLHGAGQRFLTQDLRVKATELFAKTMLALPYLVGYDYFMWVDQPALGMHHLFPEDSNYGLVQENGVPHRGITEMFAALQKDVAKWRCASLPAERVTLSAKVVSEAEKFLASAKGDAAAVKYVRTGGEWRLSNDAGVELRGKLGGGASVSAVSFDGKVRGPCGVLAELKGESGMRWIDTREVRDVKFLRRGVCGTVEITSAGALGEDAFEIVQRMTLSPGRSEVLAEIVSFKNLGKMPAEIVHLFLRPFAADKPEKSAESVPNLWKGPAEASWTLPGGLRYGVKSGDSTADGFLLWTGDGGDQHPDVRFLPDAPLVVAPGATCLSASPMSALLYR